MKRRRSRILPALFILLISPAMVIQSIARDAPVTTAGSSFTCPGTGISIPVTVNNFTSVCAITLRLEYDSTLMTFLSFTRNPLLSGLDVNASRVGPASRLYKIMVVWTSPTPTSLDNGSVLFTLSFQFLNGNDSLRFNNSINSGGSCEYADENWNPMNDIPTSSFYHNGGIISAGPLPAGIISGQSEVCPTAAGYGYQVEPVGNATGYNWDLPFGSSIISGENTNSVIVSFGPDAISGVITVSGNNDCGSGIPSPGFPVTVKPVPTAVLYGSSTICEGSAAIMGVEFDGSPPWEIIYTDGNTPVTLSDITENPYYFQVFPQSTSTYVITSVSDATGCSGPGAGSATVEVNPVPIITSVIPAAPSSCGGSDGSFSITGLQALIAYDVNFLFNGSPYGPLTRTADLSGNIEITGLSAGLYSMITVTLSNCTSDPSSTSITDPDPPFPPLIAATTPTTICEGESVILEATGCNGTVTWNDGSTGTQIVVTPSFTANYTATCTETGCTSGASNMITVTVNPLPTATITGLTTICSGESASLSVDLTGQAAWDIVYTDGTTNHTISGIQNNAFSFMVIPLETTTFTILMVTDATNCSGPGSGNATVTVNPVPSPPVITRNGNELISNYPEGNQWYYEGNPIGGATGQVYLVTHNTGYYSCGVTLEGCVSELSDPVWVVVVGQRETHGTSGIRIHPVPNPGIFSISGMNPEDRVLTMTVCSITGTKILEEEIHVPEGESVNTIDLRPVSSGIYFLIIRDRNSVIVHKFLICN